MTLTRRRAVKSKPKLKPLRAREYVNQLLKKRTVNGEVWHGVTWVRDRVLGKGGFGSVFLLKRKQPIIKEEDGTELPWEVAVKTAPLSEASTLKYEKEILYILESCPYTIRCYGDKETEDGDSEKVYCLFLEFCSGGSLSDRIKNSVNGLLESEVRAYTRDIVRGLYFIHGQGILHCDIKPDNILLVPGCDGGFVAKLADFGLAKNLDIEEEENSNRRGTYCYMSPELVKDRLLTYPADIWALGCVVVEMMTGRPAWGSGFSAKYYLLDHIGFSSEVPEFPKNISEDGKDFLSKCFIRHFFHRWSAEQLLEHPFLR